jgi:hypothetical protein
MTKLPSFTIVDIDEYKRARDIGAPYLGVSKSGSLNLSPAAVKKLSINSVNQNYIHFMLSEGSYWFYIDQVEKNGLKIRNEKKDPPRGIIQCTAFVNHLIAELDLPISNEKKSNVRLDIDFDNTVDVDVEGNEVTAYKLY